jgi:hypothetical protein
MRALRKQIEEMQVEQQKAERWVRR